MTVLADVALPKIDVLSSTVAYRETGERGAPVALFLHGNPTSSYRWRNVLPHVAPVAHCIAPDLIGFGQSGKPDIEYGFFDQIRYLDAFLENAGITSAYVIAYDWGTSLAFHLAARRLNPLKVSGEPKHQSSHVGGGRRNSAWRFPNDLPIEGRPTDVYSTLEKAEEALIQATYPKLLIVGNPGFLCRGGTGGQPALFDRNASHRRASSKIHRARRGGARRRSGAQGGAAGSAQRPGCREATFGVARQSEANCPAWRRRGHFGRCPRAAKVADGAFGVAARRFRKRQEPQPGWCTG